MTRLILELTRPYRWIIAIVLAAMLVQTAMSLAAPWPLKIILDNVVVVKHPLPHWMTALLPALGGKNEIHIVGLAAIFFVLIAVVSAVASYIANYYTETVGQWVAYDLRTRTYPTCSDCH
jgi:ABC-type multidrug transport system fused ATPase/permease subunit